MLKNYLKTAIRNFKRNKAYSAINTLGLAFGLAISFVLAFYVKNDLMYDRFHENAENIYRISSYKDKDTTYGITAGPLVVKVKENIPEIIASTRIGGGGGRLEVRRRDVENISGEGIQGDALMADPGFFEVFSFRILSGGPAEALRIRDNIFLTSEFAANIFGDEDPVGKTLDIPRMENATVAGIIESPPEESHLQFDMIIPLNIEDNPEYRDSWENFSHVGYVRLTPNADVESVVQKMVTIGKENNLWEIFEPRLQPLLDVHLGSADFYYDFNNAGKNDYVVVIVLGTIGIIVLLIAGINFINLSTARASNRAREVGIRKVVGSGKSQLSFQFIGESVLITIISFIIALIMIRLISPYLNSILNKELNLSLIENIPILLAMIAVTLLFGILSGIYPAAVLTSFDPVKVLKGSFGTSSAGILMRRILIVFQFALTISLIAGVLIIYFQIDYLQSVNMGYNRENVIAIPAPYTGGNDLFKERLYDIPEIVSLGRCGGMPGPNFLRIQTLPEGTDRENSLTTSSLWIDEDIIDLLEISIKEGRNYSKDILTDSVNSILINETLAQAAGWENPIGKRLDRIYRGDIRSYRVIGVMENFHFLTARKIPEPTVFRLRPQNAFFLYARFSQNNANSILGSIEEIYKELYPERQFNYFFLDEVYDRQFESDRDFAENIGIFCAIAIVIACLGLIGLASHTIEQRRKEITVRKILGCRNKKIILLLTSDYLKWIAFASIFAWPAAYYVMNKWLEGFTYQMSFTIWPYIIAGIGAIVIALLTILYQTIKAALTNPVESLRYE
ncbi:MAG: FtsX-like permease family protein [bacterium]|nr:FtsX-like permease family protein [bacterium]